MRRVLERIVLLTIGTLKDHAHSANFSKRCIPYYTNLHQAPQNGSRLQTRKASTIGEIELGWNQEMYTTSTNI